MIVHQGIVDSHDPVSPEKIIISVLRSEIMPVSATFKDIVEDIGTGGDDHIDQFHLDHVTDDPPHPPWDHCSGQAQENDTRRIFQHVSKDLIAFKNIPALERSMLEGLDQIEDAIDFCEI